VGKQEISLAYAIQNNRRMRIINFISLNIIMVIKRVEWDMYLALEGGGGAYTTAKFVI
jgi:hypothetical protein